MSYQITRPDFINLVDNLSAIEEWMNCRADAVIKLFKRYRHAGRHRIDESQTQVTAHTPLSRRTYDRPGITDVRWDDTDTMFPLPVLAARTTERDNTTQKQEGPEHRVNEVELGRDENADGTGDRTAEPVHPRAGRSYYHRHPRPDSGGRVQRTAARIPPRYATLLGLVPADDSPIPVPELRGLSLHPC